MSFRFLEHTSDAFLEAKGKDFQEALKEAVNGMFTMMGEAKNTDAEFEVESSSESKELLVVLFLSQILTTADIEQVTPKEIRLEVNKEEKKGGYSAKARIRGEGKPPAPLIKAVTFHMLEVKENDECTIRVLFDI